MDCTQTARSIRCPTCRRHPWQINSAPRGRGEKRHELLSGYFAAVTGWIANVGRDLDRLEEQGVRENTLVIFTSDNGMNMGHHGIYGKGNGTFPQNMYDTSVKVPALISRPGHVPEGAVNDDLLSHYDIMPTLLDYLGIDRSGCSGTARPELRPAAERTSRAKTATTSWCLTSTARCA